MFSLEELRSRLPEDVFVEYLGKCAECGSDLRHVDGRLTCSECGREFNDGGDVESKIPISEEASADGHAESHWSPPSMIAFAKGMGTNELITNHAMCRIIACSHHNGAKQIVCPSCGKELPGELGLRARLIRILTSKSDHPELQAMLGFASQLCNDYGLHRRGRSCLVFAEDLGRWVRAVGTVCILRNDPYENRRGLVRAAFYELYKLYFGGETAVGRLWDELKLDVDSCSYVKHLADQYQLRLKSKPVDAKVLEPLFEVGYGLMRAHGLEDDGFCKTLSTMLWQTGLNLMVRGSVSAKSAAEVVFVLAVEKQFGPERASESMSKLGLNERSLGLIAGQINIFPS